MDVGALASELGGDVFVCGVVDGVDGEFELARRRKPWVYVGASVVVVDVGVDPPIR